MPTLLDYAKNQATASLVDFYKYVEGSFLDLSFKKKTVNEQENEAASVCGLNGYLLMCAAAGIARHQKMMQNTPYELANPNPWLAPIPGREDNAHDQAHRFVSKRESRIKFWAVMGEWAARKDTGVLMMRIKPRCASQHTLVVERFPSSGTPAVPNFRVYQTYHNIYRLKDWLGLVPDAETEKFMCDTDPNSLGSLYNYFWPNARVREENKAKVKTCYKNFCAARTKLATTLSMAELFTRLVDTLDVIMLTDNREQCTALHGAPAGKEKGSYQVDFLDVWICDYVNPNEYMSLAALKTNGIDNQQMAKAG